jgi:hypothetical protein
MNPISLETSQPLFGTLRVVEVDCALPAHLSRGRCASSEYRPYLMLGVPRMGQSLFMDMHEREEKRVAMGLVANAHPP